MKTRHRTWWGIVMLAVPLSPIATGCDGEDEPSPSVQGALVLGEIQDDRVFAPYASDEPRVIHQGLQGGFHIFVDGRLEGDELDAECIISLRMVLADGGAEVATIEHLREPDLLRDSEGYATFDDLIVFIPDPAQVDGQQVRLEASIASDNAMLEGDEVLLRLAAE